jgi:hypothetical protein
VNGRDGPEDSQSGFPIWIPKRHRETARVTVFNDDATSAMDGSRVFRERLSVRVFFTFKNENGRKENFYVKKKKPFVAPLRPDVVSKPFRFPHRARLIFG